ncbi:uncharacterized protein LOC128202323 [Galleria mellonella]|uniref:Uncharacterized protein LOC128202323 n=1 Tax=Galleria mellonella TaxID=7137 RepID=A0ABM3N3P0_GALME|nr:uncharacterized protein LOC128202323 [Galleria mellonella]
MYSDIIKVLTDAALQTSCVYGKCVKKNVIGWNRHVRDAYREANLKYQKWIFYNKPQCGPVYKEMCLSRKIYKSKLRWCQNHQEQIKMDIVASHHRSKKFNKFWKSTNNINIRPGLPARVADCSTPEMIANMFKKQFTVVSPLGPAQSTIYAECDGSEDLLRFSSAEVANAIRMMKRGRSPGYDGLSIEHLKYAGVHLPRVLSMFFSFCLSHAYLPIKLIKTVVVPILKNKTGDISDCNNYRPISLATVVSKVLDSLLDSYLNKHLHLHDAQFGFRPGLSTELAVLSLKHTVQYYTSRQTPVFACFLDLSKAFDLVSYDILWEKLKDNNVCSRLINILKYWYTNQVNNVRWGNALSEEYKLECGVRQGGLTSPKLFNLYINDLIVGLSSSRVGCHVDNVCINNISYADDMVLLTPTIRALRQLMYMCETYSASHGLKYNVNKTEYLIFKANGKCPTHVPDIQLHGANIKRVHKFKYLGHYVTDDLKGQTDVARERRALAVRCNMLARRFARCSEEVKITLFKAYCQTFYTSSLWVNCTQASLSALRIQYNNSFRVLLGLPRFCSASSMFAQSRVDDYYAMLI